MQAGERPNYHYIQNISSNLHIHTHCHCIMAAAATTLRLLRPLSSAVAPLFAPFNNPRLNHSFAPLLLSPSAAVSRHHRRLCISVSCEATRTEAIELEKGAKIREFRRKLKIVDIKGGVDEGLNRLGEILVVRGWVRTLRAQSSVSFIEVRLRFGFQFVDMSAFWILE